MKKALYLTASLGAALFALSFFLPFSFHNSPFRRFLWALDAALHGEELNEKIGLGGASLVIVYPYLWSGLCFLSFLFPRLKPQAFLLAASVLHLAGLGTLAFLAGALLYLRDSYIPYGLQLAGLVVPLLLLAGLTASAWFGGQLPRRRALSTTLAFLPQIPLQMGLAFAVRADGGPPWGFMLGAAGALIGASACFCVYLVEGLHGQNLHSDSYL